LFFADLPDTRACLFIGVVDSGRPAGGAETLPALNYILSRRYVFEAQENVSVLKEFTLYVLLNVVALGLM